jgi:hypothetical protein
LRGFDQRLIFDQPIMADLIAFPCRRARVTSPACALSQWRPIAMVRVRLGRGLKARSVMTSTPR